MSKKENNPYLLVLTDNNGKDDEFEVLDIISFHENEYFVLYPVNSNGDTVVILQCEDLSNGDCEYIGVNDPLILEAVFAPVSYTHLDVYKRQTSDKANSQPRDSQKSLI